MNAVDVEKTMAFILDCQARTEATLAETAAGLKKTEAFLHRAVRLGVREARAERRKRQELDRRFDEKMTQLAAAQLLTEEELKDLKRTVQSFIESMRRGSNGHS
jgi:hypothetical protein